MNTGLSSSSPQESPETLLRQWIRDEDVYRLCKYFFGLSLKPSQEPIVRAIAFTNHRRVIICCMTRYGKSFCVSMGILLWILQNKNRRIAIVAPTAEKTTIIRNYMSQFISQSHYFSELLDIDKTGVDRIRKEVSKKRMTWKNGVEMRTLSAEGKGEQLMGFGADLVVVDEECDIDFEVYQSKISRMLGDSPDSCYIGIGNPNHRDNQMWEHWKNPEWHKIHIGWEEALKEGRITQQYLDEQRGQLPERTFQILYKAEFPESAEDSLIDWRWIDVATRKTSFI